MVYIGIPAYDGKLHWATVKGLALLAQFCAKHNIGYALDVIPGDAFIGKARNMIAHRFLKSGFRDLLYIDADIGFDVEGAVKLCTAEPPIVMGLYRMKCPEPVRYPALMIDPPERFEGDPSLIGLHYGPAGFMRIRREVLEAMAVKWPDEWYKHDAGEKIHDFFPHGRFENQFIGEDIGFCNRAKECGFKIWAAQNVKLNHYGEGKWESEWALDIVNINDAERKAA